MSDVAIIGMACIFPGAPDLETYWNNIRNGVDAITDAPPERLDGLFFDELSSTPDRLYSRRGGFIDEYATFDAAAFGVMPVAAMGAEPDQLLTLQVAQRALADAGYTTRRFDRDRTSIILGRGNYFSAGLMRVNNVTRVAEQVLLTLRELVPEIGEAKLAEVKAAFNESASTFRSDTAIGVVPNLVASRIANRMDFHGGAYTVDAACASSLVAVDQACHEIEAGRSEMVIAGGVHVCQDPPFWSILCQLGAVSHNQQIRPFDRRADGLLIGEGVGLLVLKDRRAAERDGDRIYAVIRGTGVSSDGRSASLMSPAVEGQIRALSRAWEASGLDPSTVGLIEAHGTATSAGDAAELETLERFFGSRRTDGERIAIGSVKSMIGHAMPAAGAAGLIKAVLSVYHGELPPSIHCEEPRDELRDGHFEVLSVARPWDAPVRRAGVNAFGFGGVNSHVIVEAHSALPAPARGSTAPAPAEALVLAASTRAELLALLDRGASRISEGRWRIAVFNPTPERIATARATVERGVRRFGRDGIFFAPGGYLADGGKLAFLFPGVEAVEMPDVREVAAHFGYAAPDRPGTDVESLGARAVEVAALLDRALRSLGATPDAIAGHSIGEWSGMLSSGMVPMEQVESLLDTFQEGAFDLPDLVFVAIGAGVGTAAGLIEDLEGSCVSHDNCAHQSIVCGPAAQMERLKGRLRERRILFEELPFRSGFHTPSYRPFVQQHLDRLSTLSIRPATVPLWSATTCSPYPDTRAEFTELFVRHLVEPVRFRELVGRLWEDGVRVFVQVGAGSLHAFVDDSLGGQPHNALSTLGVQRGALDQMRWVAAALFVEGADLELQKIGLGAAAGASSRPLSVPLGVPLVHLRPQAEGARATAAPTSAPSTATPAAATPALLERTERRVFSVDTFPELRDHCLYHQPPGWPVLEDHAPSAPMTMSVALMREAAEALLPGKLAIAVERVVASSWLRVEPPVEAEITARQIDQERVRVTVGQYAEGTVVMGDQYPTPPQLLRRVQAQDPILLTAEACYRQRWLFHGPAYQGVTSIDASDGNGIRGMLVNLPAKGALLDAAGQLAGVWIVQKTETDRVSMPVRIGRVEFYGPEPPIGARVECEVAVRSLGAREVRSDIALWHDNVPYCLISQWENWRFDTSGGLFEVMRHPERSLLAEVHPEGFVTLAERNEPAREVLSLAGRFVSATALDEYRSLPSPRKRNEWLLGRIAAKDAVRSYLFDQGYGPIYPIEVGIEHDGSGRPVVKSGIGRDLRVSISHTEGIAAAYAVEGADPGIDIERIVPRTESFGSIAFTAEELAMLPAVNRDEWMTRLWSAKEAAGKARGTGLQGSPRTLPLQEINGTKMLIDGVWVRTRRIGQHVVAWTVL
ncbi:MAG: beta-ketoacyl synthase N-terminal-like domain-containing protein [Dehalococcoidia bacterium]